MYKENMITVGGGFLTVRERILMLRIKEKVDKNPEYAKKIGIQVKILENENRNIKRGA